MDNIYDKFTQKDAELALMATIEHGATLKDIHSIPEDTMEHIYAHAYKFYEEGRLNEAETFFNFLCLYDLKNPDYFIGMGAVHQLKKDYAKACDCYSLAYLMAENNFKPMFYSGQCQLLMGNVVNALSCFDTVCKRCTDEALVKKATIYMQVIRQNMKDKAEGDEERQSDVMD